MSYAPRRSPKVGHVLETSLYVENIAASAAFYQGLFGFEKFFSDSRMCALGVDRNQVLLLFGRGNAEQASATPGGVIPPHGGAGQLHLCFAIGAADLSQWLARLDAMGVTVESRVTWPRGGTSIYFRDPDENSLELATPGLWPNY